MDPARFAGRSSGRQVKQAAESGDYALAVSLAVRVVPGMEPELKKFQKQMEAYEEARGHANWHRALRSLADARAAAISAGLPELESVVTHRLFDIVKQQHEGRK